MSPAMKQVRRWFTKPSKEIGTSLVPEICDPSGLRIGLSLQHQDNRTNPHTEEESGSEMTSSEITIPLPFHKSQVDLVIHLNLTPDVCDVIGFKKEKCEAQPRRLPVQDDFSQCSAVRPGQTRRTPPCSLPCSLPCSSPSSPMLRGRCWSSTPSSPSVGSRMRVEAALQRCKDFQLRPRPQQVKKEQPEADEEEANSVNLTGIRLSDAEGEEEEKEEEEEVDEVPKYCQLTPCICHRCPSAPPYEEDIFSAPPLYPNLDLWMSTADAQVGERAKLDPKQRMNYDTNIFAYNGNQMRCL